MSGLSLKKYCNSLTLYWYFGSGCIIELALYINDYRNRMILFICNDFDHKQFYVKIRCQPTLFISCFDVISWCQPTRDIILIQLSLTFFWRSLHTMVLRLKSGMKTRAETTFWGHVQGTWGRGVTDTTVQPRKAVLRSITLWPVNVTWLETGVRSTNHLHREESNLGDTLRGLSLV